jgi:hypothetical protein
VTSGRLIAQRYRLEEQLGAGGMGVVWRATDLELRRTVALKRSHTGDAVQIRREARIGAGLTDPHVVTVYDVVMDGDERWLVTEYLPSRSLDELGQLPPDKVRLIGIDLAGALAGMHARDIVHRDVKPANVLVTDDGAAKLTDLGIARWAEATVTGGAQVGGTAGYLAPEVAEGHEAGPPADVFALGATLYAAATGSSPWGSGDAGPYAQLRRAAAYDLQPLKAAGELAPVLGMLMAKRPEQRPTAREAQELLAGRAPARRRHWRWALAAGAVVVVLLGGAALITTTWQQTPAAKKPAAGTAGALGDARTADPCALLVPNSLARFGKVALEPNYGNFSECHISVNTGGDDTIDVGLFLYLPDEYAPPAPPGKITLMPPDPPEENKCKRTITLPNLYRMIIAARQVQHKPTQLLCGAVEAATLATYNQLSQGPIPRRQAPFAANSTALVDACSLLPGNVAAATLGEVVKPEPEYGSWTCFWQSDDEKKQIGVEFGREYPLADNPPDDSTRTTVEGHLAFLTTEEHLCHVTVVHRRYTPAVPSQKGTPRQRDETVVVTWENDNVNDAKSLCPATTTLAKAVVSRLPR